MKYTAPRQIPLTPIEAELLSKIPLEKDLGREHYGPEKWSLIADAMEELFDSLNERGAIPEIRLSIFCDAEYAEKGKKSPQEMFEANNVCDREILRSPYFVHYLCYFINGPDLPKPVITGLCRILNDDMGTSGMLLKQYCAHARASVRNFNLDRSDAARELFRLGLEIGMDVDQARNLRDAAKSTR